MARRSLEQFPPRIPVPSPSPNAEAPPEKPDQPDTGAATAPTLKPELPSAEELACRTRLTVMGAEFKEGKALAGSKWLLHVHSR